MNCNFSSYPKRFKQFFKDCLRNFTDESSNVYNQDKKNGQKKVNAEAAKIAKKQKEYADDFIDHSSDLTQSQKKSLKEKFSQKLAEAVQHIRSGKRGWEILAAALGCVIGLVGWTAAGAPVLFLIGGGTLLAVVTPFVVTGALVGLAGALVGWVLFAGSRWLYNKIVRKEVEKEIDETILLEDDDEDDDNNNGSGEGKNGDGNNNGSGEGKNGDGNNNGDGFNNLAIVLNTGLYKDKTVIEIQKTDKIVTNASLDTPYGNGQITRQIEKTLVKKTTNDFQRA